MHLEAFLEKKPELRTVLVRLALFFLAGTVGLPVAPAAGAVFPLTLQFRDGDTGQPIVVRAGVFTGATSWPPHDPSARIYQERGAASYFYADGPVTVDVPGGSVSVRAGRGFEYEPVDTVIAVGGPATATITLHRRVDMNALGWYSGDTHVHISHPPVVYALGATDLLRVAQGEDLNVINSMEEQPYFTGAVHPVSQADRIIYFSKEQRNSHYSHLAILGLRQWILDPDNCPGSGVACGRMPDASIHAAVHAQSGEVAVIAAHPFTTFNMYDVTAWPGGGMWRGMAFDLPAGAVDAIDLLSFWSAPPPQGTAPYFQALNAGFRIPGSAGTDCSLGSGVSGPAGGYRVYVQPQSALSMDAWIVAFKAGHSFVTNYPLFTHFDLDGAGPGEIVTHNGSALQGSVAVTSSLPIDRVEIIGDTGTLAVLVPPGGPAKTFSSSFQIDPNAITWVVARVTGPASGWHVVSAGGLFAQTSPVYLEGTASGPGHTDSPQSVSATRKAAASYFLAKLASVQAAFGTLGFFPGNYQVEFEQALAFAFAYFYELRDGVPAGVGDRVPDAAGVLRNAWPNPFGHEVHIEYATFAEGEEHAVAVYDAAGRHVRSLFRGQRARGEHTLAWDGRDDGGRAVASGVYFVRLEFHGAGAVSRKLVLVR
jgi:FlgD Ig-like domain